MFQPLRSDDCCLDECRFSRKSASDEDQDGNTAKHADYRKNVTQGGEDGRIHAEHPANLVASKSARPPPSAIGCEETARACHESVGRGLPR